MALTQVSDLWSPDVWVDSVAEKQATQPSIFRSGIVVRSAQLDAIASGGGISANMPLWKDMSDLDDEIQVEDTAPTNTNKISSGVMVAPICNRVFKYGGTALAAAITGEPDKDPIDQMTGTVISTGRDKRRQKRLLAILRGLFGTGATHAANAACALQGVRLGGVTSEPFDETGLDATNDQKFSPDMFIDAKALMGELAGDLAGGLLFMHPNVVARLEKLDKDGFKTGKPSDLPFAIRTYRDIPIVSSEALIRACSGDAGFVYDTYLIGQGVVGFGAKPQVGQVKDVASLQFFLDSDKNNEYVWDRTREVLHVNGTKWLGPVAGQSATNAELQLPAAWSLIFSTPNRVGAVAIRTNG